MAMEENTLNDADHINFSSQRGRLVHAGRIVVEAAAGKFDTLFIQTGKLESGARKVHNAIERRVMSDSRFSHSMEVPIGSRIHIFQFTDSIGYVMGDREHPGLSYGQYVEDRINATGLASVTFNNFAEPGADMKRIADIISDPDVQQQIARTPGVKTIFYTANGNNIRPCIQEESDWKAAEQFMRNPLRPDALSSIPTLGKRFYKEMKQLGYDYYRGLIAIRDIDALSRELSGEGVEYIGWLQPTSAHRSEKMQFVASDDVKDVSTRHVPIQDLQLGPTNAIMYSSILTALKYRELTKFLRRHGRRKKIVPISTFDIIDSSNTSFPDEHWPEEVHATVGERIVNAFSFYSRNGSDIFHNTSGKPSIAE